MNFLNKINSNSSELPESSEPAELFQLPETTELTQLDDLRKSIDRIDQEILQCLQKWLENCANEDSIDYQFDYQRQLIEVANDFQLDPFLVIEIFSYLYKWKEETQDRTFLKVSSQSLDQVDSGSQNGFITQMNITQMDLNLLELLRERFFITYSIGVEKSKYTLPAEDPDRENSQNQRYRELALVSQLNPEKVIFLFSMIMAAVKRSHVKIAKG